MKRLLIISTFIVVLSRGIHAQFNIFGPHKSAFTLDQEGDQLKSINPKNRSAISNFTLDLYSIDSIQSNAFVNLTFNRLTFYGGGRKAKRMLNLRPEIFSGTDARMLSVRKVYFPVKPNPFGALKSVKIIQLRGNAFNSFPVDFFADFPHLINLEWKQRNTCRTISPILFSKMNADLQSLVIEDRITVIEPNSFDRFKNLKTLVLHAEKLDRLLPDMFSGLHSLQHLDLSSCGISSIEANSFYDMPLTELNLGRNYLQAIPSGLVRSLKVLLLNNNQIEVIGGGIFQHFPDMVALDLNHNQINHIEAGVFAGSHMESLTLRNNSLEVLQRDTFQDLNLTLVLDLSLNRLREISSELFRSIRSLKNLHLDQNQISVIRDGTFQNFSDLALLNLGYNQINRIESGAFVGSHMHSLNLVRNSLEVLQTDMFQGLELQGGLTLAENRLQEISSELFRSIRDIKYLDLHSNRIKVIRIGTFRNLSNLLLLSLNDNQINHIEPGAFAGLHLYSLNLRDNFLEVLPSGAFQGLQLEEVLTVARNRLQEISSEAFRNFTHQGKLYLNDNEIKVIRSGTFQNLSMQSLDLSNNQINQIEPGAFAGSFMESLTLTNNSLEVLQRDAFQGFTLPSTLDLGWNGFQEIPRELSRDIRVGVSLYLNDNRIKVIRSGTFQNFSNSYLGLFSNQISHIEQGSFPFPNTLVIDLRFNPVSRISTKVDAEYRAQSIKNIIKISS